MTDDLKLRDLGAVQGESTLNANAKAHLADGEGLACASAAHADDVALEDLLTLALAFLNAVVNLHVVADDDRGDVLTDLLALDCADVVHAITSVFSRGAAILERHIGLHTSE